jgi:hypothetical protein
MWQGGVGFQRQHDANVEEVGGGRHSAATRSGDRGGALGVQYGGSGGMWVGWWVIALGRPESTITFLI